MTEAVLDLPSYDGIGLPDHEARILAEMAAGKVVLEIGSWLGRSTIAMARQAELVVSVDTHIGPPQRPQGPTCNDFLANLQKFGVAEKVIPIIAGMERVGWLLHSHFQMAFIDGAHDGISVLRDGKAASLLCRVGAPLCFHDYDVHVGVTSAVHELSRQWKRPYKVIPETSIAVIYRG